MEKLYLPYPCVLYDREKYEEITKIAADAGVKVLLLKDGDALSVGEFRMEVLSPFEDIEYKEPNEMSVVLSISCNDRKVLLTGDIQGDAEDILARRMGSNDHVSLLKVAHHGSNSSSSDAFLDKVSPRIAVISVGRNNPYKHPSEYVLWRLRERGVRIYRTDMDGMITVLLGKKEIRISSFLCRHD